MATITIGRKDIVGLRSLSFIRPQTLELKLDGCKPNTKMFPYFDGQRIGDLLTANSGFTAPSSKAETAYIVTSSVGKWEGKFTIPSMRFNTGERDIIFQEESEFWGATVIPGVATGSATATFSSNGLLATYQTTITNTLQVFSTISTRPPPRAQDPLAQSFFTYGVTGGCFITSIDVFFNSYDPNFSVFMEIRKMVNGYPSNHIVYDHAVSEIPGVSFTLPAPTYTAINPAIDNDTKFYWPAISTNASKPTTFRFPKPVYLEENSDYCFVLLSNSNKYHVFTSEMGKKSFETGQTIFEQPFIGSIFKSENNVTWSANQTEDIKFTMRQAKFLTNSATANYKLYSSPFLLKGTNVSVTAGSTLVTVKLDFKHGFKIGDKFFATGTDKAVYRGIAVTDITSSAGFTVTPVDDYTFTYSAATAAATTGILNDTGIVPLIEILSGGSGYTNGSYTNLVSLTPAPASGTAPTITTIVEGGKITSVTVTQAATPGIYTTPPSAVIGGAGAGAALKVDSRAVFAAFVPRQFQAIRTGMSTFTPPGTSIHQNISTTEFTTNTLGEAEQVETGKLHYLGKNAILKVGNPSFADQSTKIDLIMDTSNTNVSPIIDLNVRPSAVMFDSVISPREENYITAATWSGGVIIFNTGNTHSFNIGSTACIKQSVNANYDGIYTVLSVLSANQFTVAKTSDPGVFSTYAYVEDSELLANVGNASARYISKIISLETMSIGCRLYVNAMSTAKTWFDVYLRTSIASSVAKHTDINWTKMLCDVDRTLSTNTTDYKDYNFYLDGLEKFDTYDVKIVLHSTLKYEYPIIANYRAIMLAS